MKILLVAPDSIKPNLALMKLFAYHSARGDIVGFNVDEPDRIYCSILFKKNKLIVNSIKAMYPRAEMVCGGPGYDPKVRLPPEIEATPPSHDLYPNDGHSYGRVTSGCIRKCSFCVVPDLEPKGIRFLMGPEMIWKPGTILKLYDDNILAMPRAWEMVYEFCKRNNIVLDMEYFDVRLVTEKIAKQISELKHDKYEVWFSWDITKDEKLIRRGIENLHKAGVKGRYLRCFVYVQDESWIQDAKYRWSVLREYDVYPFMMTNPDFRTKRLRRIQRLGSRPAGWKSMSIEELFA